MLLLESIRCMWRPKAKVLTGNIWVSNRRKTRKSPYCSTLGAKVVIFLFVAPLLSSPLLSFISFIVSFSLFLHKCLQIPSSLPCHSRPLSRSSFLTSFLSSSAFQRFLSSSSSPGTSSASFPLTNGISTRNRCLQSSKDDAVYMSDEDKRKEYVLNDRGRIWVGSQRNFSGIPWNFGQVSLNVIYWYQDEIMLKHCDWKLLSRFLELRCFRRAERDCR